MKSKDTCDTPSIRPSIRKHPRSLNLKCLAAQYNTCKSYFPAEYMSAFNNPNDQVCFKDVAAFLPAEEREKANKSEDMWPKSAREKKKTKKRDFD